MKFLVYLLLLVTVGQYLQAQYTVIGLAKLADDSTHTGIQVKAEGLTTDSVFTSVNGSYTFTLEPGYYTFRYNKDGYFTQILADIPVLANKELALVTLAAIPDTFHLQGTVRLAGTTDHSGVAVFISSRLWSDSVVTGSGGFFDLPLTDSTWYSLSFNKTGFREQKIDSLLLAADSVLTDTVQLDSAFILTGTVLLQGETRHQDVSVQAEFLTDSTTVSALSDSDGSFYLTVEDTGYYSLTFERDSFYTHETESLHVAGHLALDTVHLDTVQPGSLYYLGTISKDMLWRAKTKHFILGDLTLDSGYTLTIEPGTRIYVARDDSLELGDQNRVEVFIRGHLVAKGTAGTGNHIHFASNAQVTSATTWKGIFLVHADSCRLKYCDIYHAVYPVKTDSSAFLAVDSCRFGTDMFGVYTRFTPTVIRGCTFNSLSSTAVECHNAPVTLTRNTIINNPGGALTAKRSSLVIANNLICNNQGSINIGLIFSDTCRALVYNNDLIGNGNTAVSNTRSHLVLFNNIISDHQAYAVNNDDSGISSGIEIGYNCLWGNQYDFRNCPADLGSISGVNSNGDSCDAYYNIFLNPEVTISANRAVMDTASACLNAGTDTWVSAQTGDSVSIIGYNSLFPHIGINDSIDTGVGIQAPDLPEREKVYRIRLEDILKDPDSFTRVVVYTAAGRTAARFRPGDPPAAFKPGAPGIYVVRVVRPDGSRQYCRLLILP